MTIPYQRIVDQENILCDEGFPAKNQPLGVEKGKPSKEGEKNCEPEPEEEMSTNQLHSANFKVQTAKHKNKNQKTIFKNR